MKSADTEKKREYVKQQLALKPVPTRDAIQAALKEKFGSGLGAAGLNDLMRGKGARTRVTVRKRKYTRKQRVSDEQIKLLTSAAPQVPSNVRVIVSRLRNLMRIHHIDTIELKANEPTITITKRVTQQVTL